MIMSFKIRNLILTNPLLHKVYTVSKKENRSYNDMLEDMVSVLHEARESELKNLREVC